MGPIPSPNTSYYSAHSNALSPSSRRTRMQSHHSNTPSQHSNVSTLRSHHSHHEDDDNDDDNTNNPNDETQALLSQNGSVQDDERQLLYSHRDDDHRTKNHGKRDYGGVGGRRGEDGDSEGGKGSDGETNGVVDVEFAEGDEDDPRNWTRMRKMVNVGVIGLMAVLSPLASSMFTPGIAQIASDLHTTPSTVVGATTGFVVCLGIGPLILAPLSETFGRRKLYLICFSIFAVSQIPTALSPNIASLLTFRAISGFFGSVGIANGGGTISDMFHPSERAGIFGWYLLGPLLGPTLGPLFGGLIVQDLNWRWLFWILTIIAFLNTLAGFFFLRESYAPVILERRRQGLQANDDGKTYRIPDADTRPLYRQVFSSVQRPIKILFTQPIVLVMSTYIAVLFGTTYSLWTNFEAIYGASGYGFSTTQVGLMYLGPGIGFLLAVFFIVPRIDTVYNHLTAQNDGKAKPEFRLPLANIGSILIPASLFTYAWTVEYRVHWFVTIVATVFFGLGQISVLNTTQNYYIDAFMKYAASAIAAGAVFRSLVGGVVPLVAQPLFEKVGYGWGISVFAFAALAMSPAPLLFQRYGPKVRERFEVDL